MKLKRRFLSILMVACLCITMLPVAAFATTDGVVIENGVVTRYTGTASEVTIDEGAAAAIAASAFSSNSIIRKVTLPESVKEIGHQAFVSSGLTEITMDGVTKIAKEAFQDTGLTAIDMPAVEIIGNRAFYIATQLAGVNMPKVKEIGDEAFTSTALTDFTMPESVEKVGKSILWGVRMEKITVALDTLLGAEFDGGAFDYCIYDDTEIVLTGVNEDVVLLENGIKVDGKTVTFNLPPGRYLPFHVTTVKTEDGFSGTVTNQTGLVVTVDGAAVLDDSIKVVGAAAAGDAYLADLSADGVVIIPTFANTVAAYSVQVPYTTETLDIQAIPDSQTATVTVGGVNATSANSYVVTVDLAVGDNLINIVVKSANEQETKTYTLAVKRHQQPTLQEIETAGELMAFAGDVNAGKYDDSEMLTVRLTKDIDMTGQEWVPMGRDGNHYFPGTFDGNGHTIRNLSIEKTVPGYYGLFGITGGTTIQNLNVTGKFVNTVNANDSGSYIGGIAGAVISGKIINCTANFTFENTTGYIAGAVGGIVGAVSDSQVVDCATFGKMDVMPAYFIGGIAGGAIGTASVTGCVNNADITDQATGLSLAGGIVGTMQGASTVSYCTNKGKIKSPAGGDNTSIAGIAGQTEATGAISYCVNEGEIGGKAFRMAGILAGVSRCAEDAAAVVNNCINRGKITNEYTNTYYTGYTGGIAAGTITSPVNNAVINSVSLAAIECTANPGAYHPIMANANDTAKFSNNYYDASIGGNAEVADAIKNGSTAKTAEELKSAAFVEEINSKGGLYYLDDDVLMVGLQPYELTVEGSYAETSGAGEYPVGSVVSIDAGSRGDYRFAGWTTSMGDASRFADASAAKTTFTMPEEAVTITANWEYIIGGSGSGGGSNAPQTPSATEGYTIQPASPKPGETVVITPEPEEGFVVDRIVVTDGAGKELPLTENSNGTYSFVQPDGDVNVRITFRKAGCDGGAACPSRQFSDVDKEAWYHGAVDYVVSRGIMNGVSDSAFAPNLTTTRGMLVTILYRLEGEPQAAGACPFRDVTAGSYYEKAITWAAENDIVKGVGNSLFAPDSPIIREQMAEILYKYAQYKGYDVSARGELAGFRDSDEISGYATVSMSWAVGAGFIQGDGTQLMPQGEALRCQVASMLLYFSQNVAK